MFDAICVSEQTRKHWTVTVSLIAQGGLIALAILVPLVTSEALPHLRVISNLLPSPPVGRARRAQAAARPSRPIVSEVNRGVTLPTSIPEKPALIEDQGFDAPPGSLDGVPNGVGDPAASRNPVIDGLARNMPVPEPPAPVVAKPSAPAAPIRIKVGGSVQEGKFLSGPRPVYPPLARAARIAGTVRLQAVISRDGAIMDLRVISGHPLLVSAAMEAVRQWVYEPTLLNGEPVEVITQIDINYTLSQ